MSIGLPKSVRNISYLGSANNQPTHFYATTASGTDIMDPLGLRSTGAFGGYGQAFDTRIYYASTSFVTISGASLTLTNPRDVICQISWGITGVNSGAGGAGAYTIVDLFANGSSLYSFNNTGYVSWDGSFFDSTTNMTTLLFNVTAGSTTFDVRMKTTEVGTEASCINCFISMLVLGS